MPCAPPTVPVGIWRLAFRVCGRTEGARGQAFIVYNFDSPASASLPAAGSLDFLGGGGLWFLSKNLLNSGVI